MPLRDPEGMFRGMVLDTHTAGTTLLRGLRLELLDSFDELYECGQPDAEDVRLLSALIVLSIAEDVLTAIPCVKGPLSQKALKDALVDAGAGELADALSYTPDDWDALIKSVLLEARKHAPLVANDDLARQFVNL